MEFEIGKARFIEGDFVETRRRFKRLMSSSEGGKCAPEFCLRECLRVSCEVSAGGWKETLRKFRFEGQ
jgi:hypothetical protein